MGKKNDTKQPGVTENPAPKNDLIFKIIGIILPFLLLIFLELSLTLFHYGHNLSLFLPAQGNPDYLAFNPHASEKYFTDPAFASTGNSELFKKRKDSKTIRLFVLGESTTIGYPYFYNGSFHRWLQYRLMHSFPEKNFEIINVALTAVNSYTIRDFAGEVVNYEPDAVLIYVGHNEYYGAMGVGSTQSVSRIPSIVNLMLELRRFRTIQLLTNTYQKAMSLFRPKEIGQDLTRMGLMVANQEISLQSKLFQQGIDQFKTNMTETLSLFQKNSIPVFVSNLVDNEKDLPPFISTSQNQKLPESFTAKYNQGLNALAARNSMLAYSLFKEADGAYSEHAMCNFYLGQLIYRQKNYEQAKTYFNKAKELDLLRFRAPDQINQLIAKLCNQYTVAHLVDTEAEFEQHSSNRIIGDELMVDHVHPNLQGYSLMSDAFFEALKTAGSLPKSLSGEMDFNQLVREMPTSTIDSLAGIFRVHNLKSRWPYNDPRYKNELPVKTEEEKLARELALKQINWSSANESLYTFYVQNHRLAEAGKITEGLVLENPYDPVFYEKAAMLCGELKNYEKAVYYFKKAFDLAPNFEKAKYLFVICLKMDQPARSIPFLDYAIANNNRGLNLSQVKTLVQKVIQLQKQLRADSTNTVILAQIADAYLKMDNRDGAFKYSSLILKSDPQNKMALAMIKQLEPQPNDGKQ